MPELNTNIAKLEVVTIVVEFTQWGMFSLLTFQRLVPLRPHISPLANIRRDEKRLTARGRIFRRDQEIDASSTADTRVHIQIPRKIEHFHALQGLPEPVTIPNWV